MYPFGICFKIGKRASTDELNFDFFKLLTKTKIKYAKLFFLAKCRHHFTRYDRDFSCAGYHLRFKTK